MRADTESYTVRGNRFSYTGSNGFNKTDSYEIQMHNTELNCATYGCPARKNEWCVHLETFVSTGMDRHFFWIENVEPSWPIAVSVPIVPTRGIWTKVRVGEPHEVTGANPVSINLSGNSRKLRDDWLFVGSVYLKDEGRATMRLILVDFVTSMWKPKGYACTVSAHGFGEELEIQKAFKDTRPNNTTAIAQIWLLMTENTCLTCYENLKALDNFDPNDPF